MAEWRKVSTKFWDDPETLDATPEDKLFWLYLLTNPLTKTCGVYTLHPKQAALHTGYNLETIRMLLKRFEDKEQILYNTETKEILIRNWFRYNSPKSPKVKALIKKELQQVKTYEFFQLVHDKLTEHGEDIGLYRMYNRTEIPKTVAKQIYERDGNKCVRCGTTENLSIDHIFPRSFGGTNHINNLRVLCRDCNSNRPILGKDLIEDLEKDGVALEDFTKLCPDAAPLGKQPSDGKTDTVSENGDTVSRKSALEVDVDVDIEKDKEENLVRSNDRTSDNPKSQSSKRNAYPDDFEEVWSIWLGLDRGLGKKKAFKKWKATLRRNGTSKDELERAACNYAKLCNLMERSPQHIKHCATFFGPNEDWQDYTDDQMEARQAEINDSGKEAGKRRRIRDDLAAAKAWAKGHD